MTIFSFGEYSEGSSYRVLNERIIRASSGILLLLGFITFINGFLLDRLVVIPYFAGFMALNFLVAVLINPKLAPTMFLGRIFTYGQSPLPIGAIQKRFAWSLGLALALSIFVLSVYLLDDRRFFEPVCLLCIICLGLLFLETAFGICLGCKLYDLSLFLGIIKRPAQKPNCMGNACD